MTLRSLTLTALLIGTFVGPTLLAHAQTEPYSGNADYQVYCSSCHGADAKGDGTIAKSLKQKPSDLTQLARRNGGLFPEERVFKAIDGRNSDSHRDMPAWADVFAKASESSGAENAAARIDVLVKYIRTLQAK